MEKSHIKRIILFTIIGVIIYVIIGILVTLGQSTSYWQANNHELGAYGLRGHPENVFGVWNTVLTQEPKDLMREIVSWPLVVLFSQLRGD